MSLRDARTGSEVDAAQRTAARVAALGFLLSTAVIVYSNFGLRDPLLVGGDMAETVARISAEESRFRLSVALDLLYCIGDVVVVAALYVLLRPVDRHLALLATLWKLVYTVTAVLIALGYARIVGLVSDAVHLEILSPELVQSLVASHWSATGDQYYVGLAFWAFSTTALGWLLLKSRYVPVVLAVFGVASSAWCALCTSAYIVDPTFKRIIDLWWFDFPMAVFLLLLNLWLLIRGLPPSTRSDSAPGARSGAR